jgi:hypothetical protein
MGFRKNRSCTDALFVIKQLTERAIEYDRRLRRRRRRSRKRRTRRRTTTTTRTRRRNPTKRGHENDFTVALSPGFENPSYTSAVAATTTTTTTTIIIIITAFAASTATLNLSIVLYASTNPGFTIIMWEFLHNFCFT